MASTIRLTRGSGYRDKARAYKVLIDGAEVGTIKDGQEEVFEVSPGPHTLRMKIDWCKSRELAVDVPEGGEASFVCRPGGNSIMALMHAVITPGNYVQLDPAEV